MAYVDLDLNFRVTSGDTIYIYKDTDNDGIDEITNGYSFEILHENDVVGRAEL
jgi:hypothetical protein